MRLVLIRDYIMESMHFGAVQLFAMQSHVGEYGKDRNR